MLYDNKISIKCTDEEKSRMEALALWDKQSMSETLRDIINAEYEVLFKPHQ